MSPEPPLDATGIARRQFSTARKGYDQAEVRAYLHELSDMVGRLTRGEAHEHDRALRAEERAQLAEQLDEHRLVELLGEETARVLDAARAAASDIRTKAEESAARMVREAQSEARSITAQADKAAAARRVELLAEVDQLRHEAEDEVERRRLEGQIVVDDMRRQAEEERERMLEDGERARSDAEAAAEQIRAAAREQGRRLVGEAQVVRERMLGDLARRRRTAREQLERLNGARERLLAAYQVVKRTVDEATTELTVALPEARLASEMAMRRVSDEPTESVEVLEAELSVARMSGLSAEVAAAEVSDDQLDAMLRELAEEEAAAASALGDVHDDESPEADASDLDILAGPDASGTGAAGGTGDDDGRAPGSEEPVPASQARQAGAPSPGGEPTAVPGGGGVRAETSAAAGHPGVDTSVDTGGVHVSGPSPADDPAVATTPSADGGVAVSSPAPAREMTDGEKWGIRLPRSRSTGARAEVAQPAPPVAPGVAPAADPLPAEDGSSPGVPTQEVEGETGVYVDELFARIRSGEPTADEPTAEAGAAPPGSADDDKDDDEDVVEVDPAGQALQGRDAALATVEREMGRKLKRVLADEQNEVLDTLRRGGTVEFEQVLPPADEHADRFAIAATAHLDGAALQGAVMAGGEKAGSCDELAGRLGVLLVGPLRTRIERSFDDCDGDLEEVSERLRALYREWKVQRIGAAVRHYTSAAYAAGAYGSAEEGTALRWLVDDSCEACPDCDDNALAGDVVKGDAFPTGDTCSPAHPDCRCLVVPAAMLDRP